MEASVAPFQGNAPLALHYIKRG